MNLKSKRGFTLVELCIVIAVLAIVVAMVTIFMPLLFSKSNEAVTRITVSEEMFLIESTINKFVLHYDNTDYVFVYANSGKEIQACARKDDGSAGNTVGRLWYDAEENAIKTESLVEEDWSLMQKFSNITDLVFDESDSVEGTEKVEKKAKLIGCTVSYKLSRKGQIYNVGLVFITHAQGDPLDREIN